ncbi:hypothetical protein [Actinomadura sp. NTSP31]|uniref:hypothetical protein n=1 Tax=Actinomadura sp. NTSP31 TaxID=1735447 RepID=UPI0035BECF1E
MFHNEIMYSVMQERVRERQAEARAARNAVRVRRARAFWDERLQQVSRPVRRPSRRRGAAPAG